MTFAITLTAVAVFLSAAAIVILAILVAAIRSDDRAKNLTCAPRPDRTGHPPPARRRRPHPTTPAPHRAPPSQKAICHDPLDPLHPSRHRTGPESPAAIAPGRATDPVPLPVLAWSAGPATAASPPPDGLRTAPAYLTGVPPIRPLRPARPDPVGRPYGALAAAPLLVTFRDRLRRGSFLACRAARVVGCFPRLAPLMPFLPAPFTRRPLPASRQMRRPVFNRVFHFCALRAGELGAACPHFHESACELL